MENEQFLLKQILDGIKSSVDDVKQSMISQHAGFSAKLDMLINQNNATDRKAEKALDVVKEASADIEILKTDIQDLKDSKKKIIWTFGGISIGASIAGNKIANFISGLFQ